MLRYLQQLEAERDALTASAIAMADAAADESRDLTPAELSSMQGMQRRCAEIDGQLTDFASQRESARAFDALRSKLTETNRSPDRRGMQTREPQGWGEIFVASPQFQRYDGGRSGTITLPGLFTRAPILVGGMDLPAYPFAPVPWQVTTPLLDSLGKVTTSSGNVTWYTVPTPPHAAAVAEGAAKPDADIVPVPHSDALDTYAHYQALSRQALEDVPQIQSTVENSLRYGVLSGIEDAAAAAIGDAASGIPSISNADLMTGVRIAIADVQTRGYPTPNAVLLNPTDFAELDIAIMGTTNLGPVRTGTVWGVPAIAVGALPAGTAYVGDFTRAVTLFSRNEVSAYMSDSHQDYFIKNLLVILAEQRALIAVTAPDAAEQVVVAAGP
jgi:hypothetical protein